MDDRELLEMAAKAAGTPGEWGEIIDIGGDKVDLTDVFFVSDFPWDPLEDDGAALQLAVKLNMLCDFGSHGCLVEAKEGNGPCTEVGDYRRAIVRAAAEIGRAM